MTINMTTKTLLFQIMLLCAVYSNNLIASGTTTHVRGGGTSHEEQEAEAEIFVDESAVFGMSPPMQDVPFHEEPESLVALQFSKDPYANQDKTELVLSGQFSLMHVQLSSDEDPVYGVFCDYSFAPQQEDPSLHPRFLDLLIESRHCQEHEVRLPLHELASASRERDQLPRSHTHSVAPSAFVFHQPKSGSTLLTNIISASDPEGSRIVSEPDVIHQIVNCRKCSEEMKARVLKDTIYFLGRITTDNSSISSTITSSTTTTRTPTTAAIPSPSLYIKLTASSTAPGLSLLTSAYPDTKWLFVHRDANTILQKLMNNRAERRQCDEPLKRHPGPHVTEYLASFEGSSGSSSSNNQSNNNKVFKRKGHPLLQTGEQTCAAYLATNLALARASLSSSAGMGLEVDYDADITDEVGMEQIFAFLDIQVSGGSGAAAAKRMQEQRDKRAGSPIRKEWKGETPLIVTDAVASATAQFSPYNRGEAATY